MTEFWRCWHISLGSFFRDYVYIPLGGNRKGLPRTILNLLIVWVLTGFWHGASWNFIFWGLFYFVFLVFEKLFFLQKLKKLPRIVGRAYTMAVVFFGWILFRFTNMAYVGVVLRGMFGLNHNGFAGYEAAGVWKNNLFFLIVCLLAVTPLMRNLRKRLDKTSKTSKPVLYGKAAVFAVLPVLLALLSVCALVGNAYNPFLYFQF